MSGFYRPKWERKWARVPRPLPVLYFERAIIACPGIFPTFRQHFIARRQTPLKILSLLISGEKPTSPINTHKSIRMYIRTRVNSNGLIFDTKEHDRPTTIEQPIEDRSYRILSLHWIWRRACVSSLLFRIRQRRGWGLQSRTCTKEKCVVRIEIIND